MKKYDSDERVRGMVANRMEWTKIFHRKKIVMILVGLLTLQVFLFLYFEQVQKKEDVELDASNVQEFHEYVEKVLAQGENMGMMGAFSQKDSFVKSNLEQTIADYTTMLDVEPVDFDGTFLMVFLDGTLLNVIVLIVGVVIAFQFVDENKTGLRSMIHATVGGRERLAGRRLGAMFLWAGIISIVFYGTELLVSGLYHEGDLLECLNYPLQSLTLFQKMPMAISIGEFLLFFLLTRWGILFFVMIVVWCIATCVDHLLLSMGIIGIIGAVEYVLYTFIPSQHPLNLLYYYNLWYLIKDNTFYSEYRNLNIFSVAVNKNIVTLVLVGVFSLCVVVISYIYASRHYPYASSLVRVRRVIERVDKYMQNLWGALLERLSLTGTEINKTLMSQRGLFVMLVVGVVLVSQTDFSPVLRSGEVEMYYQFLEKYEGVPNVEARLYLTELEKMLEQELELYNDAVAKYENGEMGMDEFFKADMRYRAFDADRTFLEQMKQQDEYLTSLKKEKGIDGWYINYNTYQKLLGTENTLMDVLLVTYVVFICSGIFSREKQCGILPIMRGSMRGRKKIFGIKIMVAVVLTMIMYLFAQFLTVFSIMKVYGISGLLAPVQSLPSLAFVPFECSFLLFLILLYTLRGLMLLVVAVFTSMMSILVSQRITIVLSFALCVPAILSVVGIDFLQYLSIVRILAIAPFMLQVQNVGLVAGVCGVFVCVGVASGCIGYRKWCVT